jgi:hypothetical protein
MNKKLKLDNNTLLKLAVAKLKTTLQKFSEGCERHCEIDRARYIRTDRKTFKKIGPDGEPYYRDELLYETPQYFIKTTTHGTIIDIERKPRSILQPKIIVKKKRTLTR